MSSSNIAVSVRGLSKAYTISHGTEKYITLAETILSRIKNPLRKPRTETFWALKDIDFEIPKGEVVGIIGRNGAGKSTLLKVLSRITEPTTGAIDIYGRVGSLLEVGTGFHPELTGRENIFLNGAILGMSRTEISRQFDAIVDFSGVEQFIDTPVKRYSSGMYVRLAFAVAAHLSSEILIVDEVLAVGDQQFQKKCLGKMKEVARNDRTVLFVSHNMQAVASLCTQAIALQNGMVTIQGKVQDVISDYLAFDPQHLTNKSFPESEDRLALLNISVEQPGNPAEFKTSAPTVITAKVRAKSVPLNEFICGFILRDDQDLPIMSTFFNDLGLVQAPDLVDGEYTLVCTLPAHFLNEGNFRIVFDIGLAKIKRFTNDDAHFLSLEMTNPDGVGARYNLGRLWRNSPLIPMMDWSMRDN